MKTSLFIGFGMLTIGFLVGYLTHEISNGIRTVELPHSTTHMTELRNTEGYHYISPLLECSEFNPSNFTSHAKLKAKAQGAIRHAKSEGSVKSVSFYYRDLNNGPWIGVEEDVPHAPASMLKVLIMMAAYRKNQENPGFLDRTTIVDASGYSQNIEDEYVTPGKEYALSELVESMIIKSDNHAEQTLVKLLGKAAMDSIWLDLGLGDEYSSAKSEQNFFSAKRFSTLFRVLYNANYLSKEDSERALELLSRTNYTIGIRTGVPDGVVVASKFGERGYADSSEKQLHECGIVYDRESPYLLCIMTKGTDLDAQAAVIGQLSDLVYNSR